jgi:hypothetical protein
LFKDTSTDQGGVKVRQQVGISQQNRREQNALIKEVEREERLNRNRKRGEKTER